MTPFEDTLSELAQQVRGADAKEQAQRRAALEANLETMVRCAIRTGTGLPGLVRWVRGALPRVTGASGGGATAERAAPVLARLLCRSLINQHGSPRADEVAQVGYATVVGT